MSDIFISYSSRDRDQALQLMEVLASAGLSVWIDRQEIDVATSWSKEIVDGINGCKAFVLLLSSTSIASHNVIKEVSLASEKRKKIVPLDLEPVTIPPELEYQLAGLQRTPTTNIDAIIAALSKIGLEATQAPAAKLSIHADTRKSLMILPFEDLSPSADNEWFANGITTELISSLSNIKALRVIDQQTTKEFKSYKGPLATYAREMAVRYFIQGSVRKFGEQIKITSTLLDTETSTHLWQDALKGTMDDIFDIQETVARRVVDGLHVILSSEEERKLDEKPTANAEAYELWLRGLEYFARYTKADFDRALVLLEESVRLDPQFARAYVGIANVSQEYWQYAQDPAHLDRADQAIQRIHEIEGESAQYIWMMSKLALRRRDREKALRFAQRLVEIDPAFASGYEVLGSVYEALGNLPESIAARKEYIRLRENSLNGYLNLVVILNRVADNQGLDEIASNAIPVFERHIRLNPDDYTARVTLVTILSMTGHLDDALAKADLLSPVDAVDGLSRFNLACLYVTAGRLDDGMHMLVTAVEKGFCNLDDFRHDPDLEPIRSTPEFKTLMKRIEEVHES